MRIINKGILITGLLLVGSVSAGDNNSSKSTQSLDVGKIFVQQEHKNIVSLLLQADAFERRGDMTKALELYRKAVEDKSPQSQWGYWACLRIAGCYLCQQPADYIQADTFLGKIQPISTNVAYRREYEILAFVVRLHKTADKLLKGEQALADTGDKSDIDQWRVPERLLHDFGMAIGGVSGRFIADKKPDLCATFLKEVLGSTRNKWLQQAILRELVHVQSLANQSPDALISARAYWLMSIQQPELLPEAIDKIIECLKALGATDSQIEKYRMFQIYGNQERNISNDSNDCDLMAALICRHLQKETLISQKTIDIQDSNLVKTRLYLLNGDIAGAVPLLKRSLETNTTDSRQRTEAIELVRMAIALHDGHVHDIDRYERYLYQKTAKAESNRSSLDSPKDPLDELLVSQNRNVIK